MKGQLHPYFTFPPLGGSCQTTRPTPFRTPTPLTSTSLKRCHDEYSCWLQLQFFFFLKKVLKRSPPPLHRTATTSKMAPSCASPRLLWVADKQHVLFVCFFFYFCFLFSWDFMRTHSVWETCFYLCFCFTLLIPSVWRLMGLGRSSFLKHQQLRETLAWRVELESGASCSCCPSVALLAAEWWKLGEVCTRLPVTEMASTP